ncbi:hypothetical protein [Paraherbaspirillum soli]|uniref:Lipoprotein n=1 Tax=Paraherbaspirillum soli TaxID=631222 RepID=A0ABW0M4U2_9BURK
MKTAINTCLLCVLALILSACASLSTAISQFEGGDYVASVKSTVAYLDKKYQKGDYDDAQDRIGVSERFRLMEANYDNIIRNTNEHEYDKKINAYSDLLEIRTLLASRNYAARYTDLASKYSDASLREKLAGEYYAKAKTAAAFKNDRLAAISFAAAVDTYQKYGDYKDAKKQSEKYLFAADNLDADRYYKQGVELAGNNPQRSKSRYRDAGLAFQQAYEVYRAHGSYKDAQPLADKYKALGIVVVQMNSNDQDGELTRTVMGLLDLGFTRFQSRPGENADLAVYINSTYRYYPPSFREYVEAVSENVEVKNPDGSKAVRTYRFNRRVTVEETACQATLDLSFARNANLNTQLNEVAESRRTTTSYYGNVPDSGRYRTRTDGYLEDSNQLWQRAQRQLVERLAGDNGIRIVQDQIRSF